MDDEPTCGRGLAENSAVPAKMAELLGSLAAVLEGHPRALDASDDAARRELEVYRDLAVAFRDVADRLGTTARKMAGQRDLPMGRHDMTVLAGAAAREAFEDFVKHEQGLLALLEDHVERDRQMLAEMTAG